MQRTSTLPIWLERGIESLQAGDINGWMEVYAEDAIQEFPFAAEGTPTRLVGRDEIGDYLGKLPSLVHFGPFRYSSVREVGDDLIVEAIGHHRRVSDNAPRDVTYVWFITLREGKVTHFRDYMNPLQIAAFFKD